MNIDLDDEFIDLFYNITGTTKVPKNIDLNTLKEQLINILDMCQELKEAIGNKKILFKYNDAEDAPQGPAILVIDDLGVITFQLKALLSNLKYDVDCSQEIYDAVNKFKKRQYDYVIMDLFIPTEREGFILLTELKKMIEMGGLNTIVGIMTASARKDIELQCKNKGADFFIEKNLNWQNELYKIMDEYINGDKDEEDDY